VNGAVGWLRQHWVLIALVTVGGLVVSSAAVAYVRHSRTSGVAVGALPVAGSDPATVEQPSAPSASSSPSASGSASSSAPAKKPAAGGYPEAGNTGVPAGTRLSAYSGPCTITANNAVIEAKTVNCGTLDVRAKNVTIRKSKINGILTTTERSSFSFTLQDSEVDAGLTQRAAVGSTNMTIVRSNIHGGQTSVTCSYNCTIRDSYLHGQRLKDGADWHLNGFLANDAGPGGRTNATLQHNTIVCDSPQNSAGGGCSGDINLFADFGPVSYVTVDGNMLGANVESSYCVYGGSSDGKQYNSGVSNIVIVNNVVRRGANKKCGYYGPVTSFNPSLPGNRWENNVWDDGAPLQSEL
jgi:hypothetical protein